MALRVPRAGGPNLFKEGYKHFQGIEEAVLRNIQAVVELSEIVRTSFGPNGRNKMVINHLERLFVTSDAATIIRELDVVHPAAKLLVMASQQQEAEMGDATNLVIILAGELLKKAEHLINLGLHPTDIIKGFEIARDKALEVLESLSAATLTTPPSPESLILALRPVIASKQYGQEDIIAPLVAQAVSMVLPSPSSSFSSSSPSSKGTNSLSEFSVDNVRVVKILGGSLDQSKVVHGMVFGREPESVIKNISGGAKVGVYTCGMDISQTETKGTVLLHNADELSAFSRGEEQQLEKYFKEIADSGVKVVVTQSSVGELALHYLNRFGILVIKILSKFELRRLCRLLGATPLARLGAPLPEEAGWIDSIQTTEIGGDRVTVFKQESGQPGGKARPRMATIVLRGATTNLLDDIERCIDDGVNVIKSLSRDPRLVPGAGSTELSLSSSLNTLADLTPGINQYAIRSFASALLVVPKTLAETAGQDPTQYVSKLIANPRTAVDIESDVPLDPITAQIFDSLIAKSWALRYATSTANTVLSVDSIIMSKPAGIKAPKANPNWDDDD